MNARTVGLTLLLTIALLLAGDRVRPAEMTSSDATHDAARIRFHITAVEEHGVKRNVVSEATVEGPAGTDFNINLQGGQFKMSARFLTDLIRPGALLMRAKLNTRRFQGYSERKLPLYEEDVQDESLELGFDEAIVLLPFGRGGGDDRFKIEITPAVSEQAARLPSGTLRPLEIKILKESPGGSIGIEASKIPHRFAVEASLLEDGREVARAASDQLVEESQEFALRVNDQASAEVAASPPAVRLTVERYARSRPTDQVALGFDVYRVDLHADGRREPVSLNWAGILDLRSSLTYDLPEYLPANSRKYQLKFNVRLADGERAD